MNILTIKNITKAYRNTPLFNGQDFSVDSEDKIGIVGLNGSGKSTLLKIIAGLEEADDGELTKGNHVKIGYLPQMPEFPDDMTIYDYVMEMQQEEEWSVEGAGKELLTKLGFEDYSLKLHTLSGGQKKKVALAAAFLADYDLLLLDEPTNHLNYDTILWLEQYLKNRKGAFLMVTHDRYFLDRVANRIVEIDKGKIYSYSDANYSKFLELKAGREESMIASERKRQSILRKEIAWMMRGARARSTKQKAHIQRYEELRDRKGPEFDSNVEISSVSQRLGKTTIELLDISKAYDNNILIDSFTYRFLKNDRIGFVGKNGCGKTTLMKMIAGLIEPDSGEIVVGQTVKIGYFAQEIDNTCMDPKDRVIDHVKNVAEYVRTEEGLVSASSMLEKFLFTPEQQYSPIEKLSGGEKRRLNLLMVLITAPNVLILDEPTNDLDITTMQILEDYLDNYNGIVITVSHDRYFLDRVIRRIFAFEEGGKLTQHEGGYTDYEMRVLAAQNDENALDATSVKSGESKKKSDDFDSDIKKASKETWTHEKKLKFTFSEAKEYEVIDDEIQALEEKLEMLDEQMAVNATNSIKLNELLKEKEEAEKELNYKMDRWVYLNDLAEQIENNK